MELLCRIVMLCAEHDIKVQAHWISTKEKILADILSYGQYTKIADKYLFRKIAKTTLRTFLKADI